MKRYVVVCQQASRHEAEPTRPIQYQDRHFGMSLAMLALTLLACSFFNMASQPMSQRSVILTRLPTLTPTPLPIRSDANESAVIVATPTETLILPPEPSPTISSVADNNPAEVTVISTPESVPSLLTSLVVLNVRSGPGTVYEVVGKLAEGQSTRVLGRNAEGSWWQIIYPPESGNTAWVSADGAFSTVNLADEVLVALAPAPPTATATPLATNTPPTLPTDVPVTPSNNPTDQPHQTRESVNTPAAPTATPQYPAAVSKETGWR